MSAATANKVAERRLEGDMAARLRDLLRIHDELIASSGPDRAWAERRFEVAKRLARNALAALDAASAGPLSGDIR